MRLYKVFAYVLFVILVENINGRSVEHPFGCPDQLFYQKISRFINNFKRSITILEVIDKEVKYSFLLSRQYSNATLCTLLLRSNGSQVVRAVKGNGYKNIIVCEPHLKFSDMLETLSKCEHFDIVIIHDGIKKLLKLPFSLFRSILNLGDNLFLDVEDSYSSKLLNGNSVNMQILVKNNNSSLIHYSFPKVSLDLARWTQRRFPPKEKNKYQISSDFQKKLFFKRDLENPVIWKPGINLITFIMLRGLFPLDEDILKQLKQIQKEFPFHNDLVLGNLIVNGCRLEPIDFNDIRRAVDSKHCIQSAFRVFDSRRRRFWNPEKTIFDYYKDVESNYN